MGSPLSGRPECVCQRRVMWSISLATALGTSWEGGGNISPGVLATKVGYFGVKSANVIRDQMGT